MPMFLEDSSAISASTAAASGSRNSTCDSANEPCAVMASAVMSRDGNGGTVALAINNRVCFLTVSSMFRKPLARERGRAAGPMPSAVTTSSSISSTAAGVSPSRPAASTPAKPAVILASLSPRRVTVPEALSWTSIHASFVHPMTRLAIDLSLAASGGRASAILIRRLRRSLPSGTCAISAMRVCRLGLPEAVEVSEVATARVGGAAAAGRRV
mmetsp:Transcript_2318/g.5545  ORF Transcript_2318/g.5545 Transcript_2318/m.5545 type:complete len:213 (+) Transcript_2318:1746-2384(+)